MPSTSTSYLERLLRELPERNQDNVARTESYLELYAYTCENPPDLPWILMAHVVSRNAGYLMTDIAADIDRKKSVFSEDALTELFLFLERANWLIFYDAWHHVLCHLLGRSSALDGRTPRFMREAWRRHERDVARMGATPSLERGLVIDLVTNEQNLIERRAVHHPRFPRARAIVCFIESIGRDAPLILPATAASIRVGRFADLARRIDTGRRLFDEVLGDRDVRRAVFAWATEHPHTGSRAAYGGRATPALREAWPVTEVRALDHGIHASPEPDPAWE